MSNQLKLIIGFVANSQKWGRYELDNKTNKLVLAKEYQVSEKAMLAIKFFEKYFKKDLNQEEIKKIQNLISKLAYLRKVLTES